MCISPWKRNKKVAIKPRLRMLTGAYLDRELVGRFAHQPSLLEEGEKTSERTRIPHCVNAHARLRPRHSGPRRSRPAPRAGSVWPPVPLRLSSRLARIGALDRDAQQPFCYASRTRCGRLAGVVLSVRGLLSGGLALRLRCGTRLGV